MLFPWNIFITNTIYFDTRFCGTSFSTNYLNYFGIAFNMSILAGFLVVFFYGSGWSLRPRIIYPLGVVGVVFSILTVIVFVHGLSGEALFQLCLGLCVVAGFSMAIFQVPAHE